MSDCAILIDTNLVLHFRAIDQIDWPSIAGCLSCTLVVAPILLRELEQQKIFNKSATLRARAAKAIDFLVAKMAEADPIVLRENVTLAFLDHEPAIDFAANRLVREVQDDHYIASALDYAAANGIATFIASSDGGMALKLRSRPVKVLRLPETYRLPAELDAEQKELREARLQIARMQAQKPSLQVRFADGSTHRAIRNAAALAHGLAPVSQIRAEHPLLPMPDDPGRSFNGDLASIGNLQGLYGLGSASGIERHNALLTHYYADYEAYLGEMDAWLERLRLSAEIQLELANDGSATATNIDVTLRFPSSVSVLRQRDWPRQPKAPKPPERGSSIASLLGGEQDFDFTRNLTPYLNIHDGSVYVDEDTRVVEFSAKSLKQKCTLTADRFLLTRGVELKDSGIEIDVEITYHEGEPLAQKLSIAFSEVEAEDSDD